MEIESGLCRESVSDPCRLPIPGTFLHKCALTGSGNDPSLRFEYLEATTDRIAVQTDQLRQFAGTGQLGSFGDMPLLNGLGQLLGYLQIYRKRGFAVYFYICVIWDQRTVL